MPTPVANRPIRKATVDNPSAARSASSPTHPPSPAEVRDQAVAQLDSARAVQSTRRRAPSWQAVARDAARAYDDGGREGLARYLQRHPGAVASLATAPREELERIAEDEAGWLDGGVVVEQLESRVESRAREGIRAHAFRTIDRNLAQLGRLREHVKSNLDDYRNAPAGSAHALIAERLGIGPGSAPADVDAAIDGAEHGLRELRSRFAGNAWEVGDFPTSANRVAAREGWRIRHGEDTVVDDVLGTRSGAAETVAATSVDVAHLAVTAVEVGGEIAHARTAMAVGQAVHGAELLGAAGLSIGILAAGLYVGVKIHHMAEEHRGEAIAEARALGI